MAKEVTANDIQLFNELNRLGWNDPRKPITPYMKKKRDDIFSRSSFTSPVEFWKSYINWCNEGVQLRLF